MQEKEQLDATQATGDAMQEGHPAGSAPLSRILRFLRTAWSIVGISLVLLFGVEMAASLLGHRLQGNAGRKEIERYVKIVDAKGASWPEEVLEGTFDRRMQWSPYVYWRSEPYSSQYVNVDDNGLRRTEHAETTSDPVARELKIFAMGGSTMWGSGARDKWTIPSILVRLLAEQGIQARITNFGQDGYASTQEVIAMLLEIERRHMPDLVIFYDGVNDVNATFQNAEAGWTINELGRKAEFRAQTEATLFTSIGLAFKHSAIARLFHPDPLALAQRERLPEAWGDFTQKLVHRDDFREEYQRRKAARGVKLSQPEKQELVGQMVTEMAVRQTARIYDANVVAVGALAREFGFDAIFYWQPVIFEKESLSDDESQLPEMHHRFVDFFRDNYRTIQRATEGESPEAEDLPHVRQSVRYLGQLFSEPEWEKQTAFRDFCHLLEQGNEAVAQAMLPDVVRQIRRRQRAREED